MITMKNKESMWKSYRLSEKLAINNYVNFSENLDTLIVELEWLSAYRSLAEHGGEHISLIADWLTLTKCPR